MGGSYETPKGNVYNEGDFNNAPLFPSYMEEQHKRWLGFIPPTMYEVEMPWFTIENGDVFPSVGLEYILHAYEDIGYTQEISLDVAAQRCDGWILRGDGYTYEKLYTPSGALRGIKVLEVLQCVYVNNLSFMAVPLANRPRYYEMRSVTETMNSVFDSIVENSVALASIREDFRKLVDIRNLEDINVTGR